MRTLHVGLRVAELDRSLAFSTSLGYEVVGEVPDTDLGHLTMLELPGDELVSVELVHDPDGNRIELVQRPTGRADGMTAADFAE